MRKITPHPGVRNSAETFKGARRGDFVLISRDLALSFYVSAYLSTKLNRGLISS